MIAYASAQLKADIEAGDISPRIREILSRLDSYCLAEGIPCPLVIGFTEASFDLAVLDGQNDRYKVSEIFSILEYLDRHFRWSTSPPHRTSVYFPVYVDSRPVLRLHVSTPKGSDEG